MYLHRMFIKNYRSIKELDLNFSKGKNIIIGRNNCGKSNIIKAINLILGENSPNYAKSENITDNDFYSWKESDGKNTIIHEANDIFIWCELKRDKDEILNYDEIYKCFGFYVHSEIIDWEGRRPIKEPIRMSKDELPTTYDNIFELTEDDSPGKDYINPKKRTFSVLEQEFDAMHDFTFAFRAYKDEYNNIIKEIRFLYREDSSRDWILAFKAPIRNEFIQSAIIPSFRDPQNQLRLTNWTWFGKLINHLTFEHNDSTELKDAFDKVKGVADKIFRDLKQNVENSAMDVAFPGTELHFHFNADTKKDLYKNCLIYIDDGFKSQLIEKGSGIQSATIIGLFNYYTQYVNTITSALLCIEEPEIYLHPHARRVISDRLDDFLNEDKNQVILSTHSVEFIRTISDINVILVNKGNEGSKALPVKIRDFKHLLIDNNKNELFFADKVIVCEGFDDFILRAVAKELFPKQLDEKNVSIVSVGGKNNISQLTKLIIKLGIKCFVFADFDYILRDKNDERDKYSAKAHENVLNLGQNFFNQKCILGDKGYDMISKLQRIRKQIKENCEKEFYTAKTLSSIQGDELTKLLIQLRQNGVGILNGEIENCSKDTSFMSPDKKFDLKKVYDLNLLLTSGEKITDFIDTNEIQEFLKTVFER